MNFEWYGKRLKPSEKNIVTIYDCSIKMSVDRTKLGKQVMLGLDEANKAIAIKPVAEKGQKVNIYGNDIRINCRPFMSKLKSIGLEQKAKYSAEWDESESMFIVKY
jgi:hypothetical protein